MAKKINIYSLSGAARVSGKQWQFLQTLIGKGQLPGVYADDGQGGCRLVGIPKDALDAYQFRTAGRPKGAGKASGAIAKKSTRKAKNKQPKATQQPQEAIPEKRMSMQDQAILLDRQRAAARAAADAKRGIR